MKLSERIKTGCILFYSLQKKKKFLFAEEVRFSKKLMERILMKPFVDKDYSK